MLDDTHTTDLLCIDPLCDHRFDHLCDIVIMFVDQMSDLVELFLMKYHRMIVAHDQDTITHVDLPADIVGKLVDEMVVFVIVAHRVDGFVVSADDEARLTDQ